MDKKQFIQNSIDGNEFTIEDVNHDNACFYNYIATILTREGIYKNDIVLDDNYITNKATQMSRRIWRSISHQNRLQPYKIHIKSDTEII